MRIFPCKILSFLIIFSDLPFWIQQPFGDWEAFVFYSNELDLISWKVNYKEHWKETMTQILSCVATSVLRLRLLHVVAFSKKLRWLAQTKIITLKTQLHAVNARWKRLSTSEQWPLVNYDQWPHYFGQKWKKKTCQQRPVSSILTFSFFFDQIIFMKNVYFKGEQTPRREFSTPWIIFDRDFHTVNNFRPWFSYRE